MPSVTATVVYAAANDCARVGDLIKSTRDKFERRILSGDKNVYIPVISPFRNVAFFVKLVGAREIRNEIREIAVEGDAKPAINPTSILSMLSSRKVEIDWRKRR